VAELKGLEKTIARFNRLPDAVKLEVASQLDTETTDLVDAMKRAAPVDHGLNAKHPGQLRDSIHKYRTPGRPLSWRILADAKAGGKFYGPHVEFGHAARPRKYGKADVKGRSTIISEAMEMVPARPFFFPTWRANKRPMRRRLSAAARRVLKTMFPKPTALPSGG
jgi:hypothetical protein